MNAFEIVSTYYRRERDEAESERKKKGGLLRRAGDHVTIHMTSKLLHPPHF